MLTERELFEHFIFQVYRMRDLQKDFFAGSRKLLRESREAEKKVDIAIQKLTGEMGYQLKDYAEKSEQQKLL